MVRRVGLLVVVLAVTTIATACMGPTDPTPLPTVSGNQRSEP